MVKTYKKKFRIKKRNKKFQHIAAYFGQKPTKRKIEIALAVYVLGDGSTGVAELSFTGGTYAAPILQYNLLTGIYTGGSATYSLEAYDMSRTYRYVRVDGVTLHYTPILNPNYSNNVEIHADMALSLDSIELAGTASQTKLYSVDGALRCSTNGSGAKRFDFGKRPILVSTSTIPINCWIQSTSLTVGNLVLCMGYRSNPYVYPVANTNLVVGRVLITLHCVYSKPYITT